MTFHRGPNPSAEVNSTGKPANHRPRNHHAPDPPLTYPTGTNSNGSRVSQEPQQMCLHELPRTTSAILPNLHHHPRNHSLHSHNAGVHAVPSYSPTSSGYSSSDNVVAPSSIVHCHSSQYPYFGCTPPNGLPVVSTCCGYGISNAGGNQQTQMHKFCRIRSGNGVNGCGYVISRSQVAEDCEIRTVTCCE